VPDDLQTAGLRAESSTETDNLETLDDTFTRQPFGVMFWAAIAWLCLIVFLAIFASWLPFDDPNRINPANRLHGIFSDGNILGTDSLGRDNLSRLAHGARISVVISLTSVTVGVLLGGIIGTTIAYYGGRLEKIVMALVNMMFAFPGLILLLAVVAMVGASLQSLTVTITVLSIPLYIRFSRGSTLAFISLDYIAAEKMLGARDRRIIFRSLLPNVLATLVTFGLLALGGVIVAEGTLAYLGFSVPVPQATWGRMIADGKPHLNETLQPTLIPATVMFLTILSVNLVGDRVRRMFDVREARL
jgi:peptide/nickel transport system permease protein